MDKHSREYQINCMKESLENKPMKKVNHFKMKKIKKIWVFSYAVTTIFGVNAIMNHLPSVHNSVAYADEASSQYTPGRYYYQENPVFISGGTIGVGMQIRVPNSLGKTIKSVTFSNGSGQKTISSFSAPIQDSLSNSYTISSNEAPLTNSPTSQAQHSYLNNPMTIMYSDGTTFTTSMGTSDVIREMETYVRRLQSQISSLTNFDDSYKSRADAAYVAKANELANSYEVNLIYPENGGVITPDFPDEAVLDAMSTDRKNQNTWFGELSAAATDKTNELNTITDAVPGGIEEANQKVTDYLTQAKGEVFAAEGSAVDSTGQEWVNKIKGIDVERVTTTPATPAINQPTEGDQEVTGTGQPGDTIVITDKGGSQLGTGTVGEEGSIKIETNRPLEKGEVITVTPSIGDKEGTPTTVTVLPKDEGTGGGEVATPATPTINQPTEGDQEVTGTGQPGDNIVITDKDGIVIGEGTVGENGSIKIETNLPLEKGEVITVTPSIGDKEGTPTTVTVLPKDEGTGGGEVATPATPTINQPTEGDQEVTGTGQPGDTIVITDKGGSQLGTGTVGEDGSIKIETNRPLEKGEVITVTPSIGDKEGTPTTVTVLQKDEGTGGGEVATPATPTINQPTEGDQEVTGTGQPGDNIVITDKDGIVIGEGTVGENGSIKIETNRPLEKGEVITVTPSTNGKKGTPTSVTVLPKNESESGESDNMNVQDPQNPAENQSTGGSQVVTGMKAAKNNGTARQSITSKNLPKTGEEIFQTTSILGVLIALLSGGIFLVRKKEQQ